MVYYNSLVIYLVFTLIYTLMLSSISEKLASGVISNTVYFLGSMYPTILFITFVGLRVDVGVDFQSYVKYFNNQSYFDIEQAPYSMGFYFIINKLNSFHFSSQSLFIVMSFVQAILLMCIARISGRAAFFVIILYFLQLDFINSLNTSRQALSMIALVLFVFYIRKSLWFKSSVFFIIAIIFHKSAVYASVLLLVFSFVDVSSQRDKFFIIIMILTAISTFFSNYISTIFISKLDVFSNISLISEYGGYLKATSDLILSGKGNTIGGVIIAILDLVILKFALEHLNDRRISYFVMTFSFCIILTPIASDSGFLSFQRGLLYFSAVKFFVCGVTLFYMYHNMKKRLHSLVFLFMYLFFYILWYSQAVLVGAAGSAPYISILL